MRRKAVVHENFFVAKKRDSESAHGAFALDSADAMMRATLRAIETKVTEAIAAQLFLAIPMMSCDGFSHALRGVVSMCCGVVERCALLALVSARQYFLKRDTVFFNVLVYSRCSAFRFPSARSE
jgi:hypothetical protein